MVKQHKLVTEEIKQEIAGFHALQVQQGRSHQKLHYRSYEYYIDKDTARMTNHDQFLIHCSPLITFGQSRNSAMAPRE